MLLDCPCHVVYQRFEIWTSPVCQSGKSSLPKGKILDWSKFKTFADDKIKC